MTPDIKKPTVDELIRRIIALRDEDTRLTLLAVCPNSAAVLEAAVKAAAANTMPMLFAATLNQVDRDGGYTGWTQQSFVAAMNNLAGRYPGKSLLYPCLDHGGPWLKDAHTKAGLSLQETLDEVKRSLEACLEAGYDLLHIDPTVDRSLPPGQPLDIGVVVERTVELIAHAESRRQALALAPISYEVGTEEVHGGLVDYASFDQFLTGLHAGLQAAGLPHAWPSFIVGKVGTDLSTTTFDAETARRLTERVKPLGSLVKGHYTDWVANPEDYPVSGMGGANVGPEFTATELDALFELCRLEDELAARQRETEVSHFRAALQAAVIASSRWQKWLTPAEKDLSFPELSPERREWLVATGARYVWTDPVVVSTRKRLYANLQAAEVVSDPHEFVIDRIAQNIQKYVDAFNLRESLWLFTKQE